MTLKLKKRFEKSLCFAFHLSTYYYMYPTCKILKKLCMPAKLLLVQKFRRYETATDRSHLHTGNIPNPKLIIKPDLF